MDRHYDRLGTCSFRGCYRCRPRKWCSSESSRNIRARCCRKILMGSGSYLYCSTMLGGMLGAFLVWLFNKDHFAITEDEGAKLACFSTGPAIRNTFSNLISEIIGTFVLVFVIFHFSDPSISLNADPTAKVGLGSVGALPVTLLVWAIGLSLGGTTGYAINPARDLAPRIMHAILPVKGSSDWGYAWIPVAGPILGAVIAAVLFGIIH
jgi:glycerol uptake facilitator protein